MLAIPGQDLLALSCVHVPGIGAPSERALAGSLFWEPGRHGYSEHDETAPRLEFLRLGLLHDAEALPRRGVQDPALAEPERDVIGARTLNRR